MANDFQRKLSQPFEAHEIEWRINRKGIKNGKPWAVAIPYITSRAVQDRLDSVFGLLGWQNEIKKISDMGFLSGISIKCGDEWITKWDGAEGSTANGMDLIKSGSSNALKRAAVLLGIGRYLYGLDESFVDCIISEGWSHPYGNVYQDKQNQNLLVAWRDPVLPPWALPGVDFDSFIDDIKNAKDNEELDECYKAAKKIALMHGNDLMLETAKTVGAKVRAEIKRISALNVAQDTNKIVTWANKQADAFALVPHKASVESVFNALIGELKLKVKGTMVDIEPIQKTITDKFNQRIKQLEQEQ